jgi:hypothetical protein
MSDDMPRPESDPKRQSIAELLADLRAGFTAPMMDKFKADRPDATPLEQAAFHKLVDETTLNTLILKHLLGERRGEVLKRSGGPGLSVHDTYEFRVFDGGADIAKQELPKTPDEPWFGSGGTYL